MRTHPIRSLLALVALSACLHGGAAAQGLSGPKPIRLVVAFAAGGPVDFIARTLAQKIGESLKKPVVVDNQPGANGVIGTAAVLKAPPDGHTLLLAPSSLAIQATLIPTLPYDTLRDTTPVALVGQAPLVLVVTPALGLQDVNGLVALARAQAGKMNYANPGSGGANQIASEMLKSMTRTQIQSIPYKGGGPGELAVMSGEVAMMFDSAPSALPLVRSGRLRALGVTTLQRSAAAPDLPTLAEAGLPGFDVSTWYMVIGPAGIPKEIVEQLNAEVNKVLALKDVREKFAQVALEPQPQPADAVGAFLRSEVTKYGKIVKEAGIKE